LLLFCGGSPFTDDRHDMIRGGARHRWRRSRATALYSVDLFCGSHHDAVMRIVGEAPGRRAQSSQRHLTPLRSLARTFLLTQIPIAESAARSAHHLPRVRSLAAFGRRPLPTGHDPSRLASETLNMSRHRQAPDKTARGGWLDSRCFCVFVRPSLRLSNSIVCSWIYREHPMWVRRRDWIQHSGNGESVRVWRPESPFQSTCVALASISRNLKGSRPGRPGQT
jgi:hypothetical protein